MSQSNVIGPIKADDWILLGELRKYINYVKTINNNGQYNPAITKDKESFSLILNSYKEKAA